MTRTQAIRRRGFTLIEMLVVISIIGILAGLIIAGAMVAIRKARVTSITTELSQMDMAMKNCRDKFGAYPPDGCDPNLTTLILPISKTKVVVHAEFVRFFRRAFPRANLESELDELIIKWNLPLTYISFPMRYSPETAMVFWLGGMPEDTYDASITAKNPNSRLIGFSKNPLCPLSYNSTSRIGPFYDFSSGKLRDPTGGLRDPTDPTGKNFVATTIFRTYLPPINTSTDRPYVYFRAEPGQRYLEYCLVRGPIASPIAVLKKTAHAKPYWNTTSKGFVNPDSFQILCAGLDGEFGRGNAFPSGIAPTTSPPLPAAFQPGTVTDYDDDLDDQTNFIEGTIKDKMP
jgi:prepilin-type N-terminal cleavage/methylation domain-containing protein